MLQVTDIGGVVAKEDERYVVKDNTTLNNLVLSSTVLYPGKHTTGHKHKGQEEVYIFTKGSGRIDLDNKQIYVEKDNIVLIEDGVFHKVYAGPVGIEFVCVFDGRRASKDVNGTD